MMCSWHCSNKGIDKFVRVERLGCCSVCSYMHVFDIRGEFMQPARNALVRFQMNHMEDMIHW